MSPEPGVSALRAPRVPAPAPRHHPRPLVVAPATFTLVDHDTASSGHVVDSQDNNNYNNNNNCENHNNTANNYGHL